MLHASVLTFQEFMTHESLPLTTIHEAILDVLRHRDDAVLFGAQAVNAYVAEPRMTQDIDILSVRAAELAQELREHLTDRFHIAVRVREVGKGRGYRLYQIRNTGNRHLADIRPVTTLPRAQRIEDVLVLQPPDLIASKVISYHQRKGRPKSGTDWRDLALLLLAFPHLKQETGLVSERLHAAEASPQVLALWSEIVRQEILPEEEDEEF